MYTPGPESALLSPIHGIDRYSPNSDVEELPESDSETESVIQTPTFVRPRWAVANRPPSPSPSPVAVTTLNLTPSAIPMPAPARNPTPIIARMRDISIVDLSGDTDDEMEIQPIQKKNIRVLSEDTVDDSDDEPPARLLDLVRRPLFATPTTALAPPSLPTPPPTALKSVKSSTHRRRPSQTTSINRHRPLPTQASSSAAGAAGNHKIGPFSTQEDMMIYKNLNTGKSWQAIAIRLNRKTPVCL